MQFHPAGIVGLIREEDRTPWKIRQNCSGALDARPTNPFPPSNRRVKGGKRRGDGREREEGNGGALRFSAFTTELRLFNYFYDSCFNYFTNLQLRTPRRRGAWNAVHWTFARRVAKGCWRLFELYGADNFVISQLKEEKKERKEKKLNRARRVLPLLLFSLLALLRLRRSFLERHMFRPNIQFLQCSLCNFDIAFQRNFLWKSGVRKAGLGLRRLLSTTIPVADRRPNFHLLVPTKIYQSSAAAILLKHR